MKYLLVFTNSTLWCACFNTEIYHNNRSRARASFLFKSRSLAIQWVNPRCPLYSILLQAFRESYVFVNIFKIRCTTQFHGLKRIIHYHKWMYVTNIQSRLRAKSHTLIYHVPSLISNIINILFWRITFIDFLRKEC